MALKELVISQLKIYSGINMATTVAENSHTEKVIRKLIEKETAELKFGKITTWFAKNSHI